MKATTMTLTMPAAERKLLRKINDAISIERGVYVSDLDCIVPPYTVQESMKCGEDLSEEIENMCIKYEEKHGDSELVEKIYEALRWRHMLEDILPEIEEVLYTYGYRDDDED